MCNRFVLAGVIAATLGGAGAAVAQDAAPVDPLRTALVAIRDAAPADRGTALAAAKALAPGLDAIASACRALPAPTATAGWSVRQAVDAAGVARPYHLYVPAAVVSGTQPAPLLVCLHGGVSTEDYFPEEAFADERGILVPAADQLGFCLVHPLGRADCAWWTAAGVAHVDATIRDVRRFAPIDPDRICLTGFSDGGSGAWFFALARPDPFAGLVPMNGSPAVAAQASERQLYPPNARVTPLFVCHTEDDQLYPGNTVRPHWESFQAAGAKLELVCVPTGGHDRVYLRAHGERVMRWILAARRPETPKSVAWWTADPALGRCRWLEIAALGPAAGDAAERPDPNVLSKPGPVRLGITIDQDFADRGVRVDQVMEGQTAAALGVQPGDIVLGIDDTAAETVQGLRAVLDTKTYGQPIRVRVRRVAGADPLILSGTIPPFTPTPVYARRQPTAWAEATVTGNTIAVTSRNVRTLRFQLPPGLVDLAVPVVVTVNGVERRRARLAPDVDACLASWSATADPGRLVAAICEVEIPGP